jgi:hypothetical protein
MDAKAATLLISIVLLYLGLLNIYMVTKSPQLILGTFLIAMAIFISIWVQ